MPSIIPGFEYDIFISYRQKDNKGDRWVSEFVEALKTELEATFKEDISVYFDINPHDGLLETHDVSATLKEKLKCLVFIPIISRTYSDPKSFAWEHEFKAFVEQASHDKHGLMVKLPNGNVANRVLPVRIHDLDANDIQLCESVMRGFLRGVEFIYKEPGVNRSLLPKDDETKNLNGTTYRNQINKVALALRDIISGLKGETTESANKLTELLIPKDGKTRQEKSIIVLPFKNLSPDPDQEYFSDGLTEEIITDLSHIHNLLVISTSSAMTFKGTNKKIKEIAGEVNVRYILEGSVRKAGNKLRITGQLIDSKDDSHLWAGKYNGTIEDIFDIQEKVSGSITNELKLILSQEEKNSMKERAIKDVQAFEYYIRAKQGMNDFTGNSLNKAIDYLNKALVIEGDNSVLYAELAHAYYQFWNLGIRIEENDLRMATEYAKKAFDLDNESSDGQFIAGLMEITGGDVRKGILHFKEVIHKTPNHSNALLWITLVYSLLGISDETYRYLNRLSLVDPFSPSIDMIPTFLNIWIGKFELAEQESKQLGPDDFNTWIRTISLIYMGKYDKALDLFNKLSEFSKNSYMFRASLILIKACKKEETEVIRLIDDKFLLWSKKDFQYSLFTAETYSMLNYKSEALDWIENSINHGNINYPFLNKFDPLLNNVRGEKRFQKLMERLKFEWESFEV